MFWGSWIDVEKKKFELWSEKALNTVNSNTRDAIRILVTEFKLKKFKLVQRNLLKTFKSSIKMSSAITPFLIGSMRIADYRER